MIGSNNFICWKKTGWRNGKWHGRLQRHTQAVRRHSPRRKNHHCLWTILLSYYLLPSLLHGTEVFAISWNFMVACWSSGIVKIQSPCFRDSTIIVCAIGRLHFLDFVGIDKADTRHHFHSTSDCGLRVWSHHALLWSTALRHCHDTVGSHVQRWCCEVWLLVLFTQFDSNDAFYESFIGCPVSW